MNEPTPPTSQPTTSPPLNQTPQQPGASDSPRYADHTGRPPGPGHDRSGGERLLIASAIVAVVLLLGGIGFLVADRLGVFGGSSPSPTVVAAVSPTPTVDLATPGLATGAPTTAAPTTPPTPATSPTPATVTPAPSGSPGWTAVPGNLDEQVAAVEAQVPPIRRIDPTVDVPNRVLSESAARDDLTRSFDKENPPAELKIQQDLLERLGFMEPGLNLRDLFLSAMASQILGYYDDDTKQMTIVQRSGGFGPLERMTLSHEYTHALQDQRFGLDSLQTDDPTEGDRGLARLALVEGDASLLMTLWAQGNLTPQELAELVQQSSDPAAQAALDRLPPILRQQFTFPYEAGLSFALRLYMQGGWDAIDAAYQKLPDSTEQILHPEKYASGEKPVSVTLPPALERLGSGWKESATDTVGEFATRVWIEGGPSRAAADEAAAGWGGDRLASYDGPNGAWAVAWKTAWDTPQDAEEFATAAAPLVDKLGSARLFAGPGATDKLILIASDDATLQKLTAAAGIAY